MKEVNLLVLKLPPHIFRPKFGFWNQKPSPCPIRLRLHQRISQTTLQVPQKKSVLPHNCTYFTFFFWGGGIWKSYSDMNLPKLSPVGRSLHHFVASLRSTGSALFRSKKPPPRPRPCRARAWPWEDLKFSYLYLSKQI